MDPISSHLCNMDYRGVTGVLDQHPHHTTIQKGRLQGRRQLQTHSRLLLHVPNTVLILLRLKKPLTDALSPQQAGGRKGHTMVTQALAVWSNAVQFEGNPYIILLDIAKAYPSTPHPLPWETMYTLGVPPTMISILRHAYERTRCCFTEEGKQHMYRQKRVVKEGCPLSPLLFCAVYECFHRTLSWRFPKQPIFKAFWDFRRAKMGHHELKTRQKHFFWHSIWSRNIFEKGHFFCTWWTLLTHFGTHFLGQPLAACRSPLGLGTGI